MTSGLSLHGLAFLVSRRASSDENPLWCSYGSVRPYMACAGLRQLHDKKLHRRVSYINPTPELHLYGWVGDPSDMIKVVTYCDADMAGDRTDAKSPCMLGQPSDTHARKQQTLDFETEIVALDHGISKEAMMLAALWNFVNGRGSSESIACKYKIQYADAIPHTISVLEDNEAACRIIVAGNDPNMRHMSRTQRIDIAWLNARYNDKIFRFVACPSDYQGADILTKACVVEQPWYVQAGIHANPIFLTLHVPAPALPPIRGVRMSDPASTFNAFINDARLSTVVLQRTKSRHPNVIT